MKQWFLPVVLVLLSLISLLSLKSIAPELATIQMLFFSAGLIIFLISSQFKLKQILNFAWIFYGLVMAGLVISLLYGWISGNTGRWIPIFGLFNAQPSQLAILSTGLVLIKLKSEESFDQIQTLIKVAGIMLLPAVLILLEPDLGTTLVYLATTSIVIFTSDISNRKILSIIGMGIAVMIFSWFALLRPYQKQRITSFINPTSDNQGASYNARQALMAVGSGQLFGQGLGQGIQSHLRFLPEYQTDFIFAAISEEFGFVGSITVLALYASLLAFILKAGQAHRHTEAQDYALILGVMLALQAGINMGMNMGLLPITGLTLPMISYGGSSILSLSLMFGLMQNIALESSAKVRLHLT